MSKGKVLSRTDLGFAVITCDTTRLKIDIDEERQVYHLKVCTGVLYVCNCACTLYVCVSVFLSEIFAGGGGAKVGQFNLRGGGALALVTTRPFRGGGGGGGGADIF